MSKCWHLYAQHILDAITKIQRIQARGNIESDDVLYDYTLRNLQTLSEGTQRLPADQNCVQFSLRREYQNHEFNL